MKIVDIQLTSIACPMPFTLRWGHGSQNDVGGTIVRVFTDEGIIGIGNANGSYAMLRSALESIMLPMLKGENPSILGNCGT